MNISYDDIRKKIEEFKGKGADLSMEEDLSIAVMNLIGLEEHLFFTGAKTGKDEYYSMLDEVREMRKVLLARMIPRTEGETWCASKHLLSTAMRLIEVGTKLQSSGKAQEAKETFSLAYKTYNLFFALRLKLISLPDVANIGKGEKPMDLNDIMKGLVDCCKE